MIARARKLSDDSLAVDVTEAARLLAVGTTTVEGLIASGDLPSFKIGKCRRIRRSAIVKYIEDQENGVRRTRRRVNAGQVA
jgi:excisionase family DNA binding protein